ncbi:hypothetical protein Emed_003039 [Eimeria media]
MEETEGGAQETLEGLSGLRDLGLSCPPNAVLQDALYSILVQGIPVPTASVSTLCSTADSQTSFVHRLFIGEADDILYKVEASGDWPVGGGPPGGPPPTFSEEAEGGGPPLSSKGPPPPAAAAHDAAAPLSCCSCRAETGGPPTLSCIEKGSKPLRRVEPTQLLIYVSYPYCRDVWHAGASELFAHYIAGKPLAPCSVSLLNRDLHAFDLLVEVENVSRDTAISQTPAAPAAAVAPTTTTAAAALTAAVASPASVALAAAVASPASVALAAAAAVIDVAAASTTAAATVTAAGAAALFAAAAAPATRDAFAAVVGRELALQLSRMRQRLQCGPIQHFLRSLGKRRPGVFREVQVRRDERIWLSVSAGVVYFIHRFVCADLLRRALTLQYCQEIAEAVTSGPRRLPEASASSDPPAVLSNDVDKARFPPDELAVYLLLGVRRCMRPPEPPAPRLAAAAAAAAKTLQQQQHQQQQQQGVVFWVGLCLCPSGFPAAGFSPDFSATTRSLRALTLAEMTVVAGASAAAVTVAVGAAVAAAALAVAAAVAAATATAAADVAVAAVVAGCVSLACSRVSAASHRWRGSTRADEVQASVETQ